MMKRTHYTNELKKAIGKDVVLAGWVHDIRLLGAINFLLLRDIGGIVQVTATKESSKEILDLYKKMHQEDVITLKGKVVKSSKAKLGYEIVPSKIEITSAAEPSLPLDPRGVTPANLDTRLDWRSIDLRRRENLAIFRIQSKIIQGFIEYLRNNDFMQVFTPSLLGGISEGGSEVFRTKYFGKEAYLRQDPQLHRQLLIAAGFEKIFDLGPSWRAELSDSPFHLTEHRTIAPEFAFMQDESDMMRVEEEMVVSGIKKVIKECQWECEVLKKELKIPKTPFPELRFPKIYDMLAEHGKKIKFGEEIDREGEKILGEFVKEKYNSDFFFINRFPSKVKPFYVMRVDEEPQWARSVDLEFKGMEMSSGGQREHRYKKIVEQIKEAKMNPENLKWFTEVFKYGVPPHGGFSIGIERFTAKLLDITNVKETTLFPRYPTRFLP